MSALTSSGGWTGGGTIPWRSSLPADWETQNRVIHEGYAAPTNLFNLGLYYRVTGDEAVVEPARESMQAMFDRWDYLDGSFPHMTAEHAALAAWAWEEALPKFAPQQEPVIRWVIENFVEDRAQRLPFHERRSDDSAIGHHRH